MASSTKTEVVRDYISAYKTGMWWMDVYGIQTTNTVRQYLQDKHGYDGHVAKLVADAIGAKRAEMHMARIASQ